MRETRHEGEGHTHRIRKKAGRCNVYEEGRARKREKRLSVGSRWIEGCYVLSWGLFPAAIYKYVRIWDQKMGNRMRKGKKESIL